MDSIIVKTKEDMEQILRWVRDYICNSPETDGGIKFRSPFQKGEVQFPFDGCRLEFQCEGDSFVRFKVYPILEALHGGERLKEMKSADLLLGGFLFNTETQEASKKWFNMKGFFSELSLRYEQDSDLFKGFGLKWLALMFLAVYYRPQFESKRQVTVTRASSRNSKKAKKRKRTKTLYTRTYVISGDFAEELPKPDWKRGKPDHEFAVRGHYRHCKSGKVAWVRPHIRCRGRTPGEGNVYIAKMANAQK